MMNCSIEKIHLLKMIELDVRTICDVVIGDCSLSLPKEYIFRFKYKGMDLEANRVVLTLNNHMETYIDLTAYSYYIQSASIMLSELRDSTLIRLHNHLKEIIKNLKSNTITKEKVYTILKVIDKKC